MAGAATTQWSQQPSLCCHATLKQGCILGWQSGGVRTVAAVLCSTVPHCTILCTMHIWGLVRRGVCTLGRVWTAGLVSFAGWLSSWGAASSQPQISRLSRLGVEFFWLCSIAGAQQCEAVGVFVGKVNFAIKMKPDCMTFSRLCVKRHCCSQPAGWQGFLV